MEIYLKQHHLFGVLLTIGAGLALFSAGCGGSSSSGSSSNSITGIWGGSVVASPPSPLALSVTDSGGDINFGCTGGTLDTPINPDNQGNFDVTATIQTVSQIQPPVKQTVHLMGTVHNSDMQLTVSYPAFPTTPSQTYSLVHGKNADFSTIDCF